MYWNNPTIEINYPSDRDPIQESFHSGNHCLFYDPYILKEQIEGGQTLQQLCDRANRLIKTQSIDGFITDTQNHYDIANLVKLNMWVDDIQEQGVVKPMMLYVRDDRRYGINNGESRLRAMERISTMNSVFGFVSMRVEQAERFKHLEPIRTFEQFAKKCKAEPGQQFLFTLTDSNAPYGIYWYEYNSQRTAPVTPGESWCVNALHQYLKQNQDQVFTPEWFDTLKDWTSYAE
jgi:hypothetical protein